MNNKVSVAVLGACGKMGQEVVKAVYGAPDMSVVGACDVACVGQKLGDIVGIAGLDVKISDDYSTMLASNKPDVVVDFAKPFVLNNAITALRQGVAVIIGTTGQSQDEIDELKKVSEEVGVGAIIAPNFAIGAILMMKFAAEAAKYMPCVEIVELHHDKKLDAPSGTSIKTAQMIDDARKEAGVVAEKPLGSDDDPARGDIKSGVHVHSVRLPGLIAHQEVMLGGTGQLLSIRHDSLDRTSFMPGVLLTIRKIMDIKTLVYGLDKLI